jgi:hypothetical protein
MSIRYRIIWALLHTLTLTFRIRGSLELRI